MEKITFSIKEVSQRTGLSRTKLYEEIGNGNLGVVKVGRRTLIPAGELDAWIDRLPRLSGVGALRTGTPGNE
mgnify:CR=1 FL=1